MAQYGYTTQFNSLMELAGLLSRQQFQSFMDDVVYPYRAEQAGRDTTGFTQLPMKPAFDMTYAALQKNNNVGVMATHVALEAHAEPTPTRGVEGLQGSIPHMATNITMGQEDYLREAKLLMEAEMVGTKLRDAAQYQLLKRIDAKLGEHDDRASYMRDYVVFNGKYAITTTNNNGKLVNVEFDFKVPATNKKSLSSTYKWWTDYTHGTEGSDANPVKDIDDAILFLRAKKVRNVICEIGYKTLHDLCRHSAVRADIALYLNSALATATAAQRAATTYGMSENQLIQALEDRLGIKFLVRDFITSIPVFNKNKGVFEFEDMTGFSEDKLVFRPVGEIGEIHSSGHLTVGGDQGSDGNYATYGNGRILCSYTCKAREKIQIWDTEETSLYVLTAGKNMYYLTVV